jgi:glucosamine--fructose-6-phosphate aminotransferase (isomerizing)
MIMENGHFTRQEILSQPEAWAAALKVLDVTRRSILDLDPARRHGQVLFTGCGSTYYLTLSAASLTQELTGLPCRAFPASELWLHPKSSYAGKALLVAISRSGETTETLRACESFLAGKRGELLTLSCYGDMPLAKMGAVNIVLPSGQERSVAQTRAFSTLYLGAVALACLWAGRAGLFDSLARLPEAGTRLLKNYAPLAADLGRDPDLDRFYWLGSGPRYGLACELSLKMKEMSLTYSEPFHFMEFRHGPMSMVNKNTVIAGMLSETNRPHEQKVLGEMEALGAKVISLAETEAAVEFRSQVPDAISGVLTLPVLQLMAYHRAIAKGLDPDRPTNLSTVVTLE